MANLSAIKLPNGTTYNLKDNGALQLTGGSVTGPVSFGDSVSIDEATVGDLVVNGSASFTNNIQANTINGVAVGSSPKFTDTTYSSLAAANGGTAVSLVTTGEKYTWNNKIGATTPTIATDTGTSTITLASAGKYKLTAGGGSVIFTMPTIPTVNYPVTSVNSKTGAVSLTAADVGALASNTTYVSKITTTAGAHTAISNKSGAVSFNVPTKTSHLTNDSGFITNAGVTGLKGDAESSYRTGNVNITSANIGAVAKSDELQTTNPFTTPSLKGPYISKIDNAFYAADKRWTVTATNGGPVANLFDGSYETTFTVADGVTSVVTMDFSSNTYFPGYPYGYILVSVYYTARPASISCRAYCNYEPHGLGWFDIPLTMLSDSSSAATVYRGRQGRYNISKIEFTITGQKTGSYGTMINQIEMHLDRPDSSRTPFLSKYGPETLYYTLTAPSFIGNLTGNVTGNVSGSAGSVAWSGVTGKPTSTGSKVTGITASTTATKTTLGTAFTIPNVTSAGSASTWEFEEITIPTVSALGEASTWTFSNVSCDDITSWNAGSGSASISGAVDSNDATQLNITINHTHTAPTLQYTARTVSSKTGGHNSTAPTGSSKKVWSMKSGANGSAPTLGTAFTVPNVTGNTSATVSVTDPGHTHSI